MSTASDLLGLPVPSDAPGFLMALGAHVMAGLTCVIAGAVAAMAPKRMGVHPRAGLVYLVGLFWLFVSSCTMAAMRFAEDAQLFAIGVVAFTAGGLGSIVRLRQRPGWMPLHIAFMGVSLVAVLTGFYVDNGPNLPGWRNLPSGFYWFLPSAVGIPLALRAIRREAAS